jgi:hypothetical protein
MKNACSQCLAALAMVSQKHVLGRGMQNFNEVFSYATRLLFACEWTANRRRQVHE